MSEKELRRSCGNVSIVPSSEVVAGSYQTWTITYTVGELGMDDGSTLKIASHQTSDWGTPQFSDPSADNYATVETNGDAAISAQFDSKGHIRPWKHTVQIDVKEGSLKEGEEITLTLGDTSGGSRGHQAQTFCERDFRLIALTDMVRTGEFVELPDDLTFDVVAGPVHSLPAVVTATTEADEPAKLSVRAEDYWGNVATDYSSSLILDSDATKDTLELPNNLQIEDGIGTTTITAKEPGTYRVNVSDPEADLEATSNPLVCLTSSDTHLYWGDIHGQSGETVGTGTIQEYFSFAKESAFLDFASHAANDFQITDDFWNTVQTTIREFNSPGDFVTFLCYEWSANTPNGGDHNVYFRDDSAEIHRSSNWQIPNTTKYSGTYPIDELYNTFQGRDDVLIIPHQGGRPATLETLDPELTPFVEIVSVWGIFEWFGQDALEQGYEVGFVGGSDDHTARPGVGPPDNLSKHNVKGGLMAVPTDDLTRDNLWKAFKDRRFYATTGARIYLETEIDGQPMGSHLHTNSETSLEVTVRGTSPIQEIDLFRGAEHIASEFLMPGNELLEFRWSGARSKARDKLVDWSGGLQVDNGKISAVEEFGFDHPEQGIINRTPTSLEWNAATTGNTQGVRISLEGTDNSTISIKTEPVTTSFEESEIDDGLLFEAGNLNKQLDVTPRGRPIETDISTSFSIPDVPGPYYVRVRQVDGELAWSSPIFLKSN